MGVEIERKYLPRANTWRRLIKPPGLLIRQGYLAVGARCTVRVRIKGSQAWLTAKGPRAGASRPEFDYPIPIEDAAAMLDSLCEKPLIEKTRHIVSQNGHNFEIDEFHSENAGLVVIELELQSEDQSIELPDWIGQEVTGDPRYYNSSLARHPFTTWPPTSAQIAQAPQ